MVLISSIGIVCVVVSCSVKKINMENSNMSFVQSVKRCFVNYKNFSGRSSRADYWFFYLFDIFVFNLMSIIQGSSNFGEGLISVDTLIIMIGVGVGVPYLAVGVRRLHDVNRSGWWLLAAVTITGIFLLLYWLIKAGDAEPNRFGEKPIT